MKHSRQAVRNAALLLLLVLGATGMVIGQGSENSSASKTPGSTVPSIFVRILPHRMEPEAVTVSSGPLEIIVQNRSTAPNIRLELHEVGGKRLKTVSVANGQHHSLETYDLTPGSYMLSEAKHPEWHCTIIVK